MKLGNPVTKDSSSNIEYFIAEVTVRTVALIGVVIACTIAGIMNYRHKKAVAVKISKTLSEHLSYGNEEEISGSKIFSTRDSSAIDMSGSSQEVALPGAVTTMLYMQGLKRSFSKQLFTEQSL